MVHIICDAKSCLCLTSIYKNISKNVIASLFTKSLQVYYDTTKLDLHNSFSFQNAGNRHEQFLILQNLVRSRMSSRLCKKNPRQDKHPHEIVATYTLEPPPEFEREPLHMRCPCCRAAIWTRTENHISSMTWYCFGCWSLCIESLHDVKHYCPKCNQLLGEYKGGCS